MSGSNGPVHPKAPEIHQDDLNASLYYVPNTNRLNPDSSIGGAFTLNDKGEHVPAKIFQDPKTGHTQAFLNGKMTDITGDTRTQAADGSWQKGGGDYVTSPDQMVQARNEHAIAAERARHPEGSRSPDPELAARAQEAAKPTPGELEQQNSLAAAEAKKDSEPNYTVSPLYPDAAKQAATEHAAPGKPLNREEYTALQTFLKDQPAGKGKYDGPIDGHHTIHGSHETSKTDLAIQQYAAAHPEMKLDAQHPDPRAVMTAMTKEFQEKHNLANKDGHLDHATKAALAKEDHHFNQALNSQRIEGLARAAGQGVVNSGIVAHSDPHSGTQQSQNHHLDRDDLMAGMKGRVTGKAETVVTNAPPAAVPKVQEAGRDLSGASIG